MIIKCAVGAAASTFSNELSVVGRWLGAAVGAEWAGREAARTPAPGVGRRRARSQSAISPVWPRSTPAAWPNQQSALYSAHAWLVGTGPVPAERRAAGPLFLSAVSWRRSNRDGRRRWPLASANGRAGVVGRLPEAAPGRPRPAGRGRPAPPAGLLLPSGGPAGRPAEQPAGPLSPAADTGGSESATGRLPSAAPLSALSAVSVVFPTVVLSVSV